MIAEELKEECCALCISLLSIDTEPWRNGEVFLASFSLRAPDSHRAAEQTCSDQGGNLFPSATAQPGDRLKMYNFMQQLDDIHNTGRIVTYTESGILVKMIADDNHITNYTEPANANYFSSSFLIFCKRSKYLIAMRLLWAVKPRRLSL